MHFMQRVLVEFGALTLAGAIVCGLLIEPYTCAQSPQPANTPPPSFEVASIKPDHLDGHVSKMSFNADSLTTSGVTLKHLIEFAYSIKDFQLSGGPAWVSSETYEIQAKIDDSTVEALRKLPHSQRSQQHRLMLQSLLAERFKLQVSHSSKELPIYALVFAKSGPKFTRSDESGDQTGFRSNNGNLTARGVTMSQFAAQLSGTVGRKVVDKTDLQGRYDLNLSYARETLMPPSPADTGQALAPLPDSSGPSIFTALQDQLGLKLESQKGPVDTLIIESAQKPSPN